MADKKVKGAGDRFLPGSNIAKHREWRGLKDTWYDYVEWVKVLGIMGGFVAKSPVRIARGVGFYVMQSSEHIADDSAPIRLKIIVHGYER